MKSVNAFKLMIKSRKPSPFVGTNKIPAIEIALREKMVCSFDLFVLQTILLTESWLEHASIILTLSK